MMIAIEKLLAKMEAELQLAKTSSKEENLREKIYSIKIICELILEEKTTVRRNEVISSTSPAVYPSVASQPMSALNQAKKLETEDGANGDSLFDF
ncbi:YwdI family protein [Bacillota bacterium Lsc_1132]